MPYSEGNMHAIKSLTLQRDISCAQCITTILQRLTVQHCNEATDTLQGRQRLALFLKHYVHTNNYKAQYVLSKATLGRTS